MPRTVPEGIAADLERGCTTLSRCYIVERVDGLTFGFTDHDAPLTVKGVACEPETGFDGSSFDATLGAATDGMDLIGGLDSEVITRRDVELGLWDRARVESLYVNWTDPTEFVILGLAEIAETIVEGTRLTAILRSMTADLNVTQGYTLGHDCPYEFGDARCTVDLSAHMQTVTVSDFGPQWIEADAIAAQGDPIIFEQGEAVFGGGERVDIAAQDDARVTLWQPFYSALAVGDAVSLIAGCDKSFDSCIRFENAARFGGEPHMTGPDTQASTGSNPAQDGGVSQKRSGPPDTPVILGAGVAPVGSFAPIIRVRVRPFAGYLVSTGDGSADRTYALQGYIDIRGLSFTKVRTITIAAELGTLRSDEVSVSVQEGAVVEPDP